MVHRRWWPANYFQIFHRRTKFFFGTHYSRLVVQTFTGLKIIFYDYIHAIVVHQSYIRLLKHVSVACPHSELVQRDSLICRNHNSMLSITYMTRTLSFNCLALLDENGSFNCHNLWIISKKGRFRADSDFWVRVGTLRLQLFCSFEACKWHAGDNGRWHTCPSPPPPPSSPPPL